MSDNLSAIISNREKFESNRAVVDEKDELVI